MVQSITATIAPSAPVLLALAPKTWRDTALPPVERQHEPDQAASLRASYASVLVGEALVETRSLTSSWPTIARSTRSVSSSSGDSERSSMYPVDLLDAPVELFGHFLPDPARHQSFSPDG